MKISILLILAFFEVCNCSITFPGASNDEEYDDNIEGGNNFRDRRLPRDRKETAIGDRSCLDRRRQSLNPIAKIEIAIPILIKN